MCRWQSKRIFVCSVWGNIFFNMNFSNSQFQSYRKNSVKMSEIGPTMCMQNIFGWFDFVRGKINAFQQNKMIMMSFFCTSWYGRNVFDDGIQSRKYCFPESSYIHVSFVVFIIFCRSPQKGSAHNLFSTTPSTRLNATVLFIWLKLARIWAKLTMSSDASSSRRWTDNPWMSCVVIM